MASEDGRKRAPGRLAWIVGISALAVAGALVLFYPLARTPSDNEVNSNEGWNAYRAQAVARGDGLYREPPGFFNTNYPPLSFHLIALLGRVTGDYIVTGRVISLTALLAIAALLALIVRQLTQSRNAGWYAAASVVLWLTMFQPDRIGMDDPQMLGMAIGFFGLYVYVAGLDSPRALCLSAAAFAISLFIKHNLLPFPAAVGLDLLLVRRKYRNFAIWAGAVCGLAGVLTGLTLLIDGRYFFLHLLTSRVYSIPEAIDKIDTWLRMFGIAAVVAAAWSVWNWPDPKRRVWVLCLVLTCGLAMAVAGGDGIDRNHFFDAICAIALIVSMGAADIAAMLPARRWGTVLFAVLLLAPSANLLFAVPFRARGDFALAKQLPADNTEFASVVNFLRDHPGPALCTDLVYCFAAGKPQAADLFVIETMLKTEQVSDEALAQWVRQNRFTTIQFRDNGSGLSSFGPWTDQFASSLMENHKVGLLTDHHAILVPDAAPVP